MSEMAERAPTWRKWTGQHWCGDPEQLVWVTFHDGRSTFPGTPVPARLGGLAGEASCWRWEVRRETSIVAYALAALHESK